MIGTILGNYEIVGLLGTGGMGEVYLARHRALGKQAAVKVLLPEFSSHHEIIKRFFNEARAATTINHASIVEIYDFGYHDCGSAYIVMEYLQGESLHERLRRMRAMPVDQAMQLVRQIAGALEAAHGHGIIHRDLKPDNIFIVPDSEVNGGERIKLLDFGIAKLLNDSAAQDTATRPGMKLGTPTYMAPEQCSGFGHIDQRTDLYSLGCILFQMLVGRPPFDGRTAAELWLQHLRVAPPSPRTLLPSLSPQVESLIDDLLAKDANQRPRSARAVMDRIDGLYGVGTARFHNRGFLAGTGPGAPRPQTTLSSAASAPVTTPHGPARWRVALPIAAVLAVAGGTYGLIHSTSRANPPEDVKIRSASSTEEPSAPTEARRRPAPPVAKEKLPAEEDVPAEKPAPAVSIVIRSVPGEVDVFHRGEKLGNTPLRVELQPGTTSEYTLEKRGFHGRTVTLPADAQRSGEVAVELAPLPEETERAVSRVSHKRPRSQERRRSDRGENSRSRDKSKKKDLASGATLSPENW